MSRSGLSCTCGGIRPPSMFVSPVSPSGSTATSVFGSPTPTNSLISSTPRSYSPPTPTAGPTSLPTDGVTLQAMVKSLQADLEAITSVKNSLADSVARLEAEKATLAADTTTTQIPCAHQDHPRTIASGRGAASPELFKEIIKTNWHGRLGRTHMVDVDNLPDTALMELDCLVRRKLHAIYPRNCDKVTPDTDAIFAGLAALGLRMEDRGPYADVKHQDTVRSSTVERGWGTVSWRLTHQNFADYWQGSVVETLLELGKYRGLFDNKGFLKV